MGQPDAASERVALGGDPSLVRGAVRIDRAALGGLDLVDPGDAFGYASTSIGDLDGDGIPEVAVGTSS